MNLKGDLEAELGATPVTTLSVVADGVVGGQTNPLGDGAVLASLLAELVLDLESLVRGL